MASRKRLTDRLVREMRCPAGKSGVEITDAAGHLSVWCGPSQKKYFRYRYSFNGRAKRLTVGLWHETDFTVDVARATVAQYNMMRDEGRDPAAFEADAREANRGTTVAMVLDYHLDTLKDATRYNVTKLFKDLRAMHGKDTLEQFTPAVAKAFVEDNYEHRRGAARSLVRNAVAAFNKALSPHSGLSRPPGYQNPFRDIRKAVKWWKEHRVKNHAQALEDGEWKALFAGIRAAHQTDTSKAGLHIIELLLMTGARPSEIASLKVTEIHQAEDIAWIDKADHKMAHKDQERRIWLMPAAMEVIEAARRENERYRYKGPYLFPVRRVRKDQKRLYVANVNHYMDIVAKHAKVRVTPYALRGAYISFALDTLGFDWLEMVSQNVGHSDPVITLRHYRKHRPSKLVDAARKIEAALALVRAA